MTIDTQIDGDIDVSTEVSIPEPGPLPSQDPALAQEVKNILHGELSGFLSDVEFRLAQTAQINARMMQALEKITGQQLDLAGGDGQIFAEDLNLLRHQITGYTVTSNSPGAGSIAWTAVNVVYNGTNYALTNSNTNLKYAWFDAAISTTVMQVSNTKPVLSGNACLLFYNDGGIVREILNASIPPVVGNSSVDSTAIQANAVGTTQLANGAVTAGKTDFYTALAGLAQGAMDAATLAQATADGSITTYFQPARPWADGDATAGGATNPANKVGDVWYEQATGKAYRWGGAGATPANTWIEIVDTQAVAALAAANAAQTTANSRITTFYANVASPPTALAIGDLWIVTDQGNQLRRATATGSASWVTLQVGSAAIADSAITDVKVATGIGGAKITAGTIGSTQLGAGAVTPVKVNILQHILY